uniref:G-protein coupled receptor GRL101-like n=1 Tax=Styela clava TaxID=7725 RepID=UPI00193A2FDA|nr:G-protein coupled receptor GRL101-like [Styela clava]
MELVVTVLSLSTVAIAVQSANNTSNPSGGQFSCSNGILIDEIRKCNGVNDCRNWDDECECGDSVETLCQKRPCLNGDQEIRRRQLCDGIFDCDDLSDECLCDKITEENRETHYLCKSIFSSQECEVGEISCATNSPGKSCVSAADLCDGLVNCMDESDERHCYRLGGINITSQQCKNPDIRTIAGKLITVCLCDGKVDLEDGEDEQNCDRYFYCSNDKNAFSSTLGDNATKVHRSLFGGVPGLYIDWRRTFDGVQDCPDVSDEWHDRFVYCPKNSITNESHHDFCNGNQLRHMASPSYAIKSRIFAMLQWLIGLITITANGTVVILTMRSLAKGSSNLDIRTRRANQVLVLNLSSSDMLLGIQMLAIGVSDATMSGQYWKYDLNWKSGSFCLAIGFLAITLTQVSILTIFVISVLRLYTVLRPFAVVRVRYISFVAIMIWVVAMFAAKMPTMDFAPEIEDYFLRAVAIPNLPQVDATVIERNEVNDLLTKAYVLEQVFKFPQTNVTAPIYKNMRWRDLESALITINPQFGNWRYYSYFAHTSMCLPSVIVKVGSHAWEYTFISVVVDISAYAFVVIAYAIVMRKTRSLPCSSRQNGVVTKDKRPSNTSQVFATNTLVSRVNRKVSKDSTTSYATRIKVMKNVRQKENRQMQKRIFWLVFTDFLCWAPILILNIVNMISPQDDAVISKALSIGFILMQLNSMSNPFIYSRPVRRGAIAIIIGPCRIIYRKFEPILRKPYPSESDVEPTACTSTATNHCSSDV